MVHIFMGVVSDGRGVLVLVDVVQMQFEAIECKFVVEVAPLLYEMVDGVDLECNSDAVVELEIV